MIKAGESAHTQRCKDKDPKIEVIFAYEDEVGNSDDDESNVDENEEKDDE